MEGYIGLYRCLLEKPIWKQSTPEQKSILITILLMVNHQEAEWEWNGKKFKTQPGQKITSLEKIAEASGCSVKNVRTAIARFEKLEFLANESTKTGRLITVLNWHLYQVEMKSTGKAIGNEVAKTGQRGGKGVATNNNDNNDKNIFSSDSNEYRLAAFLKNWILKNNPSARVPEDLQKWSKTFDLMIRVDKRTVEEIRNHIEFSQKDTFWKGNILSADTLRKQYDQLTMKMQTPVKDKPIEDRPNAGAYKVFDY